LSLINFVSPTSSCPSRSKRSTAPCAHAVDFSHIGDAIRQPAPGTLMVAWLLAPFAFLRVHPGAFRSGRCDVRLAGQQLGWFFTVIGATAAVVQGYGFASWPSVRDRALLIAGASAWRSPIAVASRRLHSSAALYGWTAVLAFSTAFSAAATTRLVSCSQTRPSRGRYSARRRPSALGPAVGAACAGKVYDASHPAAVLRSGATIKGPPHQLVQIPSLGLYRRSSGFSASGTLSTISLSRTARRK